MSLKGTVVFSSGRTADFDIWSLDLPSGRLSQLTTGKGLNNDPRWSPDGSKIAYLSIGEDLISSLWVMNRDGSDQRRLTTNVHAQHPSWDPKGEQILFTANADNSDEIDICLFNLKENSFKVLFHRPGVETEPHFSPDGTKLIFAAVHPDSDAPFAYLNSEIWERDLSTGDERQVFAHPARDYSPVYSPDGKRIALISHGNGRAEQEMNEQLQQIKSKIVKDDRASIDQAIADLRNLEQDSEVCVVDVDGNNFKQLTENRGADTSVRWSPCGEYLLFSSSPKGKPNAQRLKIINSQTGETVPFEYDRQPLMTELDSSPDRFLNATQIVRLLPDFIERIVIRKVVGSYFFGEEHSADWTYC